MPARRRPESRGRDVARDANPTDVGYDKILFQIEAKQFRGFAYQYDMGIPHICLLLILPLTFSAGVWLEVGSSTLPIPCSLRSKMRKGSGGDGTRVVVVDGPGSAAN